MTWLHYNYRKWIHDSCFTCPVCKEWIPCSNPLCTNLSFANSAPSRHSSPQWHGGSSRCLSGLSASMTNLGVTWSTSLRMLLPAVIKMRKDHQYFQVSRQWHFWFNVLTKTASRLWRWARVLRAHLNISSSLPESFRLSWLWIILYLTRQGLERNRFDQ